MRIIRFKQVFFTLVLSLLFTFNVNNTANAKTVRAEDIRLTPGGETIGIEINTQVIIVDTYSVQTVSGKVNPAQKAGLKAGDVILKINQRKINSIKDVQTKLQNYNAQKRNPLEFVIRRNGKTITRNIVPVKTKKNTITLGCYLRDHITGVGTLTFVYDNRHFAALGHKITSKSIPELDDNASGFIKKAEVTNIKKGYKGSPGEKRAYIDKLILGEIRKNNITGIYGTLKTKQFQSKPKMKIGLRKNVRLGKAKILTVIEKNEIEEFDIEIIQVNKQSTKDIKGIKFRVTDKELINATGGIIQGMSGSPIIQDGRIIGAVTHVLIEDSTVGYGLYVEFMLEDMGIFVK